MDAVRGAVPGHGRIQLRRCGVSATAALSCLGPNLLEHGAHIPYAEDRGKERGREASGAFPGRPARSLSAGEGPALGLRRAAREPHGCMPGNQEPAYPGTHLIRHESCDRCLLGFCGRHLRQRRQLQGSIRPHHQQPARRLDRREATSRRPIHCAARRPTRRDRARGMVQETQEQVGSRTAAGSRRGH